MRYYFNGGEGRRDVAMGHRFDPEEYERLMRTTRSRPGIEIPHRVLARLMRAARTRARNRSVAFDLTPEFMADLYARQEGRCALTGIRFDLSTEWEGRVRPYGISIDRIVGKGGYTQDNVRLLCTSLNIAINEFGWEVFRNIAKLARLRTPSAIADKKTGSI